MIPPPKRLCRSMSTGRNGNVDGSLPTVSWDPIPIAMIEDTIPARGPATAKSNIASFVFGGSLKVVTELVVPVISEGTKVGNVVFIFEQNTKLRKLEAPKSHTRGQILTSYFAATSAWEASCIA